MTISRNRRNFLLSLSAATVPAWAQSRRPVLGIVPYLPARRLVGLYAPLLPVMERSLGKEIDIVSASDYRQHLSMLRAGEFDIVADSLFISRIAHRELSHIPVARTMAGLETLIVAPANSTISGAKDLHGKVVCVTDRIASLALIGLRYLRDQGLVPGQGFNLLVSGSHSNSIHLMLAGNASAAIISKTTLTQIDAQLARRIKVIATPPKALASVVYHVHPRLKAVVPQIQKDLIAFANESEAGKAFIKSLGHDGLLPLTPHELKSLDPMVVEFYRQLAS